MISSLTDSGGISTYHSAHEKPDAASVLERRIQIDLDSSDQDWQGNRHERLSKQSCDKEISIREDAEEVPVVKYIVLVSDPFLLSTKYTFFKKNSQLSAISFSFQSSTLCWFFFTLAFDIFLLFFHPTNDVFEFG